MLAGQCHAKRLSAARLFMPPLRSQNLVDLVKTVSPSDLAAAIITPTSAVAKELATTRRLGMGHPCDAA